MNRLIVPSENDKNGDQCIVTPKASCKLSTLLVPQRTIDSFMACSNLKIMTNANNKDEAVNPHYLPRWRHFRIVSPLVPTSLVLWQLSFYLLPYVLDLSNKLLSRTFSICRWLSSQRLLVACLCRRSCRHKIDWCEVNTWISNSPKIKTLLSLPFLNHAKYRTYLTLQHLLLPVQNFDRNIFRAQVGGLCCNNVHG